jgi:hypothetical protein
MLLSQITQYKRKESFDDLYFFPYYDKNGKIKGSVLILEQPKSAMRGGLA